MSLIVVLFAIWIAATAAGGWPAPVTLGLGALAVAAAALAGLRIGAFDRESLRGYARAATTFAYGLARWPKDAAAAVGMIASVFAGRGRRAGYVRLKLQPDSADALADVLESLSASPGVLVVDADVGSALVHVFDEAAADVATLKITEHRAAGGAAGGAGARKA